MLVLKRKPGQSILIGSNIQLTVISAEADQVKIGFTAPRDVAIVRDDAVRKSPRTTVTAKQSSGGCCGQCTGKCKGEHHG